MTEEIQDREPGAPEAAPPGEEPESAGAAGAAAAGEEPAQEAAARDVGPLAEILEALVFVHRGILVPRTVREVLGEEYSVEEIAAAFAVLREEYERRGGAITLLEVAGGYQFGTRTDLAPWIQKLDFYEHHRHLSKPTLETLAIIAYKQPVTRAEIEAIRGVSVERIVRNLLDRRLVRVLGHKDVPGKPAVLGTTREFLELFGLKSLASLPPLEDFAASIPPDEDEGQLPLPGTVVEGEATDADADQTEEAGHGPDPETGAAEPGGADEADPDAAGERED